MAKAIVAMIIVVFVMAVIVSLLNRDGREGFWKFKEGDGFTILGFGVLAFILFYMASKIVVQSIFWMSVVRTLPWIVIIVAIWVYTDKRLCDYRSPYARVRDSDRDDDDYDEPWDDEGIVYPWDEDDGEDDEDEGDVKWPWDE